jgi:hypothetical protein
MYFVSINYYTYKQFISTKLRVVAVSVMPQRVVVVLKQPQRDISRCDFALWLFL